MRLLIVVLFILSTAPAAAMTTTLGYQGVLTDGAGSTVPDGDYTMHFGLYVAPTGGAALWLESQVVTVADGNFDVVLGSVVPITGLSFEETYWLGLRVDSDPEMTPRTELVGSAYAHFANNVADESITEAKLGTASVTVSKIAVNTLVRSINSRRDHVNLIGGDNVTVTTTGQDIEVSTNAGVASAKGITSNTVGTSYTSFTSRSINCPTDGYVLVIGSGDAFLNHVAGNPTYVQMGVSTSATSVSFNQDLTAQIPFSAASGSYTIPFTSQAIFPVTAGNHTFHQVARRSSNGTASLTNRQLSLVFLESSYGSVSQPAIGEVDAVTFEAGSDGDGGDRGEPSPEELAREVAELRARLESLSRRLER